MGDNGAVDERQLKQGNTRAQPHGLLKFVDGVILPATLGGEVEVMRAKVFLLLVPLLASASATQVRACSQCMCGTPFPAEALGGVVPMQVRYGFEDRYLSKA